MCIPDVGGPANGVWTAEDLRCCGLTPLSALRRVEKGYQDALISCAEMAGSDLDGADSRVSELESYVTSSRRSLRALILTHIEEV